MDANASAPTGESILIADAEVMACELLQYSLQNEGFNVSIAHSAEDAMHKEPWKFDLILVDLMDCATNGLMFTDTLKNDPRSANVPIIFISQYAAEDEIVSALDAGADDFVAKPFSARMLSARVRSVLRRRQMARNRHLANILVYEGLKVDMGAGTATIDNEAISLTKTEHNLLTMFLRHRNQFFERCEIRLEAWDEDATVSDRTVDVNISRLRKKIGNYGNHIVNRTGYGYGFVE